MIAWLRGRLSEKQAPWMLIDVQGVGYELEAPLSVFYDLPAAGEEVSIYVHMVVREDAQLLYGFANKQQRDVFRMLIKMNGVGPKVALAVLSTLSIQELAACAVNQDVAVLTKVPGIGQKTALRLLVELEDRLEKDFSDVSVPTGSVASHTGDAISALVQLGYKSGDASKVVRGLDADLSSEEMIRQALRILSGNVL